MQLKLEEFIEQAERFDLSEDKLRHYYHVYRITSTNLSIPTFILKMELLELFEENENKEKTKQT